MLRDKKFLYLLAGIVNTIFGYSLSLLLYHFLFDHLGLLPILLLGNFLAISEAFLLYKIFVFKTKGKWLAEYLRSFMVYGGSALIGMLLTYFFVNILTLQFWIAQGLSIPICIIFSYIGHSNFTFSRKG